MALRSHHVLSVYSRVDWSRFDVAARLDVHTEGVGSGVRNYVSPVVLWKINRVKIKDKTGYDDNLSMTQ